MLWIITFLFSFIEKICGVINPFLTLLCSICVGTIPCIDSRIILLPTPWPIFWQSETLNPNSAKGFTPEFSAKMLFFHV